jgi:hypothetical protein
MPHDVLGLGRREADAGQRGARLEPGGLRDMPVSDSATVATRVISTDNSTMTSTEMRATIVAVIPGDGRC